MTSPRVEPLEQHDGMGRTLYLLSADTARELAHLEFPVGRFVCFLAWDSAEASIDEVYLVARSILEAGAVYVCVWGTGCERVHDTIDEVLVEFEALSDSDTIMTTAHASDTLTEALWFDLFCTSPTPMFADDCNANVLIVIRNNNYESILRDALSDMSAFRDVD